MPAPPGAAHLRARPGGGERHPIRGSPGLSLVFGPAPDEAGAGSGFFWDLPVHWTVVDIATGGEGLPLPA